MSDDKRTVSTDALETLGTIINENEKRDAIHLAVVPVQANQRLIPAQDVGIDGTGNNPVGIVDPFLNLPVFPGQYFWLVIYPRKITSLRHVWSHPDIPDDIKFTEIEPRINEDKKNSIEWIENYGSTVGHGYSYDKLMEYAKDYIKATREGEYPEYLIGEDEMEGEYVDKEFWDHYEIVTGESLSKKEKEYNFFSCAC